MSARDVIVAVAINTPLRRLFDYRVPASLATQPLQPGQRIWVPFGRRRVVGVIIERRTHSDVPAAKLRPALELVDTERTLDGTLLELLLWAAEYYRHPAGEVIAAALPGPLRQGAPLTVAATQWSLAPAADLNAIPRRAHRQHAVIEYLQQHGATEQSALLAAADTTVETLRTLAERGHIIAETRHTAAEPAAVTVRPGPPLDQWQQAAVTRIAAAAGQFETVLLHGVTGSGKTEVYLHAIANAIAQGGQALVLVPEIALTPQLVARFQQRFDTTLAVLHSALSDGERLSAWRDARAGRARIVIGTRSAIFVPLAQPKIIVVDEEHDPSFKQQDGFRYSGRDLAIVRAQRERIPIVLGSATPSLESLERARRQPSTWLKLPQRAAAASAPRVALIDLRRHGQAQGIAQPVLTAMQRHLAADGQVLLFLNRRGYAPVLFCPGCGWSAPCLRCDAHLTVHRRATELICHHCGTQQPIPTRCPSCAAPVKPVGQGTERIEETVQTLFPDAPLARIDRDSTSRKGELEAVLGRIDRKEVKILVGTQMLAKGHHFPDVTLVVVLNADQGLFSTDFRAAERLAQTIVQVAGRAGRAERSGEVMIQTEYPEHPLLTQLIAGGYEAFAESALQERKDSGWPPFSRVALLRAEAAQPATALQFLRAALAASRDIANPNVRMLGPAPAPMERRAGRYRAQLLVQAESHGPLQRTLSAWIPRIEALPEARRVRWSIDVDPAELF